MSEQSAMEKFTAWVKENRAKQPSLGAELKAMAREAVKDVRATIHETFFGQAEHVGEIGAPLNPTAYETTKDRTGHAVNAADLLLKQPDQPQQDGAEQQQAMDGRSM